MNLQLLPLKGFQPPALGWEKSARTRDRPLDPEPLFDQDQVDAQYFLGLSYHAGLGVLKNRQLAIYWLQKSARQGSKPAQALLKEIGV